MLVHRTQAEHTDAEDYDDSGELLIYHMVRFIENRVSISKLAYAMHHFTEYISSLCVIGANSMISSG